jgi:urease accessory protein
LTTRKATRFVRAMFVLEPPVAVAVLEASERHLRRKLITLADGSSVMVDLAATTKLEDGDCLQLDDGTLIEIRAAAEDLIEVKARDAAHLAQLAWHIGNRHLDAQIEARRILIRRDHVIAHMLEHQGATVREVREIFSPEHGAYHGHGDHSHAH